MIKYDYGLCSKVFGCDSMRFRDDARKNDFWWRVSSSCFGEWAFSPFETNKIGGDGKWLHERDAFNNPHIEFSLFHGHGKLSAFHSPAQFQNCFVTHSFKRANASYARNARWNTAAKLIFKWIVFISYSLVCIKLLGGDGWCIYSFSENSIPQPKVFPLFRWLHLILLLLNHFARLKFTLSASSN